MKNTIRERIIRLSYLRYPSWILILVAFALAIIIATFRNTIEPLLVIVLGIIALIMLAFFEFFYIVQKTPEELVKRNKLSSIIVSNEYTWAHLDMYVWILFSNISSNAIVLCSLAIVCIAFVIFLPRKIAKFFKNKLIK